MSPTPPAELPKRSIPVEETEEVAVCTRCGIVERGACHQTAFGLVHNGCKGLVYVTSPAAATGEREPVERTCLACRRTAMDASGRHDGAWRCPHCQALSLVTPLGSKIIEPGTSGAPVGTIRPPHQPDPRDQTPSRSRLPFLGGRDQSPL